MRDLPSIASQQVAISDWLVKYGGRRPSEAAMEASRMGAAHRRKLFRNLRDLKCIEHGVHHWRAVRGLPTPEAAIINAED